jgi:hypothetical protein
MATTISYQNNYGKFTDDFKKDTGLDPKKNTTEYIAYFNARINDMSYQLNHQIGEAILQKMESIRK